MAWASYARVTEHTCGGPVFGRKTKDCPRCDELLAGAKPVKWSCQTKREREERQIREIKAHNCKERGCGPVCTFGDW